MNSECIPNAIFWLKVGMTKMKISCMLVAEISTELSMIAPTSILQEPHQFFMHRSSQTEIKPPGLPSGSPSGGS